MRHALVLGLVASCAIGAPVGFSSGDRWTFPLVDPLGDGLVITPVMVTGKGPYLFAIDPDVKTMLLDERVAIEAGLRTDKGFSHRPWNENGDAQFRFLAEMQHLQVGDLEIERRTVVLVPHDTFDRYGRDIKGVIGRDVLADSLAFGFDRERGIAFVETQRVFTPPAGATAVHYENIYRTLGRADASVPRRMVTATIGSTKAALHLALGALTSGLREPLWSAAGLAQIERSSLRVDDVGSIHETSTAAIAPRVGVASIVRDQLPFTPFRDARYDSGLIDGILGLDFFRPFDVWTNDHTHTFYLVPRADSATSSAIRFARWGAPIATCAHPGCVTAHLVDPTAGTPLEDGAQHPGFVLSVTRDPGVTTPLEVTLGFANRADLPKLIVNVPAGVDRVMEHLRGNYAGAELAVLDVSPYPLHCPTSTGCVMTLQ